jgi:ABC-type branched-subunit amino acid transport system permease subunit
MNCWQEWPDGGGRGAVIGQSSPAGTKRMSGIYFGFFVVAVLLVVRWSMTSDRTGTDGATGIFAMTERRKKLRPEPEAAASRFRRKKQSP